MLLKRIVLGDMSSTLMGPAYVTRDEPRGLPTRQVLNFGHDNCIVFHRLSLLFSQDVSCYSLSMPISFS